MASQNLLKSSSLRHSSPISLSSPMSAPHFKSTRMSKDHSNRAYFVDLLPQRSFVTESFLFLGEEFDRG